MNLNFLDRFSKNTQISNLMKIRRLGAELFNADGWTDGQTVRQTDRQTDRQKDKHDEAKVAFRNFAISPKNEIKIKHTNNKLNRMYQKTDRTLRTALFWAITQQVVVIYYLRFGKTYRSHLQGQRTDRMSRNVGKELQLLAA